MNEQEKTTWIAEKVHGWHLHKDGYIDGCKVYHINSDIYLNFEPYNNVAQAIEALEAWKRGHEGRLAVIYMEAENCVQLQGYKEIVDGDIFSIESTNPNLAHAICDALVKATGGE